MKRFEKKDKIYILILAILSFFIFGKVLFTGKMLFGTDWVMGEYIQRYFVQENIMSGNFPLWNPMKFAGIPSGEGFLGDIFYPITFILRFFVPLFILWTLTFIIHSFLAGFGTYMFARNLTSNRDLSFFGAIAYMFTGIILTETYGGHDGRVIVISYLPILLYFLYLGFNEGKFYFYGFAGISAGFMFLSGHIQSSLYVFLTGLFFVSFLHIDRDYSFKLRNWTYFVSFIVGVLFSYVNKNLGFLIFIISVISIPMIFEKKFNQKSVKIYLSLLFFGIITFLVSSVQYIPILRFLPDAARGVSRDYNYSISWSMGFPDLIDMFFHGFSGVNVNGINTYWGMNPFKLHHSYPGIIVMFLGISGIFRKNKKPIESFFSIIFFITLIISLGGNTPFFKFFWKLFPYFDKFRAPELIIFINIFSLVILSLFALKEFDKKSLSFSFYIILTLGLLILLFPGFFENIFSKNIIQNFSDNVRNMKLNNLRVCLNNVKIIVLLNLFVISILYFVITKIKNLKFFFLFIFLSLFQFFEMYYFTKDYIVAVPSPGEYYKSDGIVSKIREDMDLLRVFPISYGENDFLNLYKIQTISGIHPSPFYEYQIFVNNRNSVMFNSQTLFEKKNRIKLLNVKYLITPQIPADTTGYDENTKNLIILYQNLFRNMGFEPYYYGGKYMLHRSVDFLPRFFVVDSFVKVKNVDEAIFTIDSVSFDPRRLATVEDENFSFSGSDEKLVYFIDSIKYTPNMVYLKVKSSKDAMLIFLDQYYKAWKVKVNERSEKLYKVDGIFRGVKIKKGTNDVIFFFSSTLQIFAFIISLFGILIVYFVFIIEKRILLNKN